MYRVPIEDITCEYLSIEDIAMPAYPIWGEEEYLIWDLGYRCDRVLPLDRTFPMWNETDNGVSDLAEDILSLEEKT